jgi:hypothetical protein
MLPSYPGTRSKRGTRKARVTEAISLGQYEKQQKRVSMQVCVESKMLNGKKVTSYTLSHDSYEPGASSYKAEYTDEAAFGKCVAEAVTKAAKAL